MRPKLKTTEDLLAYLNQMVNQTLGGYQGRRKNSMIYWNAPRDWRGTRYLFGYTPWKTLDPETRKRGYFALKYRELKNGNCKLVKSARFGRRKVARARALKWYNQYYH